jgi:hypothetical protein
MTIENIKNQNLICLDFDDCIIEYRKKINNKWVFNSHNEIIEKLKNNVNKIKDFCEKYNYKVFIISSWSTIIDENTLQINENLLDNVQKEFWNILKELPIIGVDPFNDRILAMEVLIENQNKIICIDDLDLTEHFKWAENNFIMINIIDGIGWNKFEKIKKTL